MSIRGDFIAALGGAVALSLSNFAFNRVERKLDQDNAAKQPPTTADRLADVLGALEGATPDEVERILNAVKDMTALRPNKT